MLPRTKKQNLGFTLLDLLISVGILGGIGIIIVGSLYTILITRSKQQSIEATAASSRALLTTLTNAIVEADQVTVPAADTIQIKGAPCRSIRKNGLQLEQALDISVPCVAPTSGWTIFTPVNITVSSFVVSKVGKSIQIQMSGNYKDAFGTHDFDYQTSATPRSTI